MKTTSTRSRYQTTFTSLSAIALGCLLLAGCGHEAPSGDATQPAGVAEGPASNSTSDFADLSTTRSDGASAPAPEKAIADAPADFGSEPSASESDRVAKGGGDDVDTSKYRKVQHGVLTAGSFDDHRRYGDFRSFLTTSQQSDPYESFPRLQIGQRVLIHVHNEQGEPIANSRVEIQRPASQSQQLFSVTTGSDGRALFLTHQDAPRGNGNEYLITVRPPQSSPIQQQVNSSTGMWDIEIPEAQYVQPKQLDLALVIDATGSMGDEMNYLKIEIDHIAATIKQMFPSVDQRFALIVYRDNGDAFVTRTFDFTKSLSEFRTKLSQQGASGGGDYPEAMDAAMEAANQLTWRGGNTARVMFLIGDAPPHDRNAKRAISAANALRKNNVRVYPIAASGAALKAEFVLRATAFLTMGEYLFLTDHSGVGNPHAAPHVPDYQVEHLNRMMVRMIAQELAGKKLAPAEVLAIENGDTAPLQFQPIQQAFHQRVRQTSLQQPTIIRTPASPPAIRWPLIRWLAYGLVICGAILLGVFFSS